MANHPRLGRIVLLAATLLGHAAQAQITVHITRGAERPLPIALVPFGGYAELRLSADVAQVVEDDLRSTGRFEPMARTDMPGRPQEFAQVALADWQRLGMENLVVGRVLPAGGGYRIEFWLIDVYRGKQMLAKVAQADPARLRLVAHQIADAIYQALTGVRGAFATRVAYVTVQGRGRNKTYRLLAADTDGQDPQTLLTSRAPLLSPAWSPDGRRLAYVSFESRGSAVYVQNLHSGQRNRVAAEPGINSAPAWSPDGSRLALTLSRDGNAEVYVLNLSDGRLQRITKDPAIDTEPVWSPDGRRIAFTSDRSGGPQIYEAGIGGGRPRRLTHQGNYNARPRYSSNGRMLAVVHGDGRSYRIATVDLDTDRLNVVTDARLDESPSFAPNDSMIIYSTLGARGSELAAVSTDGRIRQSLSVRGGQAREPAWGPFR
ncbi:MAG: Tol-Pal system beta propeller repeat protein TolB [Gammaproteobacteria bacterium]